MLPPGLKLSPEQFALACEANPEAVLELTAAGQVIAMTPTGGDTSARNNLLSARLQVWALGQGGWKVFDSPVASASPMAPCSAPMRPCCGWSAGRRSRPNNAAAFRRSAPIWWWSW